MSQKKNAVNLSYKEAKLKAAKYCSYQERSHQQVRDKLYEYGLFQEEVEELIVELISDGFINEERFAKSYAGGKFRIKKWGRLKIIQGLKQHNISDYCINKGLQEIDEELYYQTLSELSEKKKEMTQDPDPYQKKHRIASFLISKGYEPELVWECLKE